MAISLQVVKAKHDTQKRADDYAVSLKGKQLPGWTMVTVSLPINSLPVVHAIAAAFTTIAHDPREKPFTVSATLNMALEEGLAAIERRYLGTCSLDDSDSDAEQLPRTTPAMLALVRAATCELGFGELPSTDQEFAAETKKFSEEQQLLRVPVGSLWRYGTATYRVLGHEDGLVLTRNIRKGTRFVRRDALSDFVRTNACFKRVNLQVIDYSQAISIGSIWRRGSHKYRIIEIDEVADVVRYRGAAKNGGKFGSGIFGWDHEDNLEAFVGPRSKMKLVAPLPSSKLARECARPASATPRKVVANHGHSQHQHGRSHRQRREGSRGKAQAPVDGPRPTQAGRRRAAARGVPRGGARARRQARAPIHRA